MLYVEYSVRRHNTHLLAHIQYRAYRAARTATSTDVLAKRHQEAIDLLGPAFIEFKGARGQFRFVEAYL